MKKDCPCGSGAAYATCCAPIHRGDRAADAPERLVRARFAAFARGEAEFLWRTLHPDHDDRARDKGEVLADLRRAAQSYRYLGLTILDAEGSRVLFKVRVFDRGKDRSFVELSEFAREGGEWRYLTGTTRPAHEADRAETIAQFERG